MIRSKVVVNGIVIGMGKFSYKMERDPYFDIYGQVIDAGPTRYTFCFAGCRKLENDRLEDLLQKDGAVVKFYDYESPFDPAIEIHNICVASYSQTLSFTTPGWVEFECEFVGTPEDAGPTPSIEIQIIEI